MALLVLSAVFLLGGFPGTSPGTDPRVAATATAAVRAEWETATAIVAAHETDVAATAAAAQTAVSATSTAVARAVPYTYRAVDPGVGCDPTGNYAYEFLPSKDAAGYVCLPGGGGTQDGYASVIEFLGSKGFQFSPQFTYSIDVQIGHPQCGTFVDVTLNSGGYPSTFRIQTCDAPNGNWAISATGGPNQTTHSTLITVTPANSYHFAIVVVANASVQFLVNSQLVFTVTPSTFSDVVLGPAVTEVGFGVVMPSPVFGFSGTPNYPEVIFSNFSIVPNF